MSLTTMSQNQEIIEAKLCAYIDGELDLEGRSEIERHLEANPQHRRLLESLKATKDLVRWLPREQAPPEVAETLNGQLERSVLLDYDGDSLRPSMWPRALAAAAIVALTAGLGAAVFFALPKSQKSATPYAYHTTDQSTLTPAVVPEAAPNTDAAKAENVTGKAVVPGTLLAQVPDRLHEEQESARASGSKDLDELAQQVVQNRDALFAAANSASQSAPPLAGNAMVMLVRSDRPQRTEKQLVSYLDSQNIRWKQAPIQEGQAIALQMNAVPNGYEVQRQQAGRMLAKEQAAVASTQSLQDNRQSPANVAGVYVARMSPEQAAQLNSTISVEGAQAVALQSPGVAGGQAPQGGTSSVASATTQPAIQLPDATQAPAASDVPTAPSAQAPAFAMSATTMPATQPAQEHLTEQLRRTRTLAGLAVPAQEVAPAAPSATQPTTQPVASAQTPTTKPSELALDVVILVQPNTVANTAVAPATQPAEIAPPATQPVH